MVRLFPKSANQPNEMALTICTSISCNCFRLMRDWKLESLANGKEISAVPFKNGKRGVPLKVLHNFRTEFPENYLAIWLQTEISGFSRQMVSTRYSASESEEKWANHKQFSSVFVSRAVQKVMLVGCGWWFGAILYFFVAKKRRQQVPL